VINARILLVVLLGIVGLASSPVVEASGIRYETIGEIRLSGAGGSVVGGSDYRAAATRGGYIYVVSGGERLSVFDGRGVASASGSALIVEPTCEMMLDFGNPVGLLLVGDRLYCYGWEGGEVLDVSDPSSPVRTGFFGDRGTHIFQMVHHDGYLVAACHDRLILYSLAMNADYPTVVKDLPMEADTYVYSVCVIGERLCAAGFRKRQTGETAYWLGSWDFSTPERTALLRTVRTDERGYRLISLDGLLLAISENRTELWRVDEAAPSFIESVSVCGRAVARDGGIAVLDEVALDATDGRIEVVGRVDCPEDRCHTGLPRLGATADGLVILPRTSSIAILRRTASD